MSETIDGASLIAKSLKDQGVEYIFGYKYFTIIKITSILISIF
jgi:hypothetical protein